jgi:SAM-dependent methyltransferase
MTPLKRAPLLENLYSGARCACLVKSWEFSGVVVARYYSSLLLRFGTSPQALDERSDLKEHLFYDHLFNGVMLAPTHSVLDIGCGMGNLIEYIEGRGVQMSDYQGIDLVQRFVDVCQEKYDRSFVFRQANFVSDSFLTERSFDLVVSVGGLVSRVLLYEQYIEYSIRKMIRLSNKYVLFNVITGVDSSLGNYRGHRRIGQITYIPKRKLLAILDAATRDLGARYELHEVNIYPDATDAFVCITVHNP